MTPRSADRLVGVVLALAVCASMAASLMMALENRANRAESSGDRALRQARMDLALSDLSVHQRKAGRFLDYMNGYVDGRHGREVRAGDFER